MTQDIKAAIAGAIEALEQSELDLSYYILLAQKAKTNNRWIDVEVYKVEMSLDHLAAQRQGGDARAKTPLEYFRTNIDGRKTIEVFESACNALKMADEATVAGDAVKHEIWFNIFKCEAMRLAREYEEAPNIRAALLSAQRQGKTMTNEKDKLEAALSLLSQFVSDRQNFGGNTIDEAIKTVCSTARALLSAQAGVPGEVLRDAQRKSVTVTAKGVPVDVLEKVVKLLENISKRPNLPNPDRNADWKTCQKWSSHEATEALALLSPYLNTNDGRD